MSIPAPRCSCIVCHKEVYAKGIHLHYIKLHTNSELSGKGTLKFISRCSCLLCHKETTIQSLKEHQNKCTKPVINSTCLNCNNTTFNTKFCSHSCASKHRYKTNRNAAELKRKNRIERKLHRIKICPVCLVTHF